MQRYNNTINLAHFEDERDCQNKRLSCEKLRSNFDKPHSKSLVKILDCTPNNSQIGHTIDYAVNDYAVNNALKGWLF